MDNIIQDVITKTNDAMPKRKPNENKGIIFNIIKYFVAMLPVIIPFTGIFYLTNNILITIFVTFILDVLLIVAWSVYLFKNPDIIESYKK